MDETLIDELFLNQTTPEKTERVLEWFDTPEGKQYLQARLNIDHDVMHSKEFRGTVPDFDSRVWQDQLSSNI